MFSLMVLHGSNSRNLFAQSCRLCRGKRSDDFFHSFDVREVELRAFMEGWEANCVDKQVELLAASAALKRI